MPHQVAPGGGGRKRRRGQVRVIANDPVLLMETLARAKAVHDERLSSLRGERAGLARALAKIQGDVRQLATRSVPRSTSDSTARLTELHERARTTEARVREIDTEMAELEAAQLDEHALAATFRRFDELWSHLSPREQAELIRTLIHRIEFDAQASDLSIAFHDGAIGTFAHPRKEEAA